MSIAFALRSPTEYEIEKLRLVLSTYQDGSGQLKGTLPGWRDFERSVAITFNGIAVENKGIYDVLLSHPNRTNLQYGLACKMRSELRQVDSKGRVYIEVSNAAAKFWGALNAEGIYQENLEQHPKLAGKLLIDLVDSWHEAVDLHYGGSIDSKKSPYLILQWDSEDLQYQLFQFPVDLIDAQSLVWEVQGKRLQGSDRNGVLVEWYFGSGAQLKYYPSVDEATWSSKRFRLEPISVDTETGIINKAAIYFPEAWEKLEQLE